MILDRSPVREDPLRESSVYAKEGPSPISKELRVEVVGEMQEDEIGKIVNTHLVR